MNTMREIVETNEKISEAKTLLKTLKEEESAYLLERETKALLVIQKVLGESSKLVSEIRENYKIVQDVQKNVLEQIKFLVENRESLAKDVAEFEKLVYEQSKSFSEQEKELKNLFRDVKIEQEQLESDKKTLAREKTLLKEEKRKIDDQRGVVERMIERLKQKRI